MTIDIYYEFGFAQHDVPHFDDAGVLGAWLARRGLTFERRNRAGGLGVIRGTVFDNSLMWEPNPDGERLLVIGAWDGPAAERECSSLHLSDLIDLIAWRPTDPTRLFVRLGMASLVGIEGRDQSIRTGFPLRLYRHVERYVAGGGETDGPDAAAILLNEAMAFHMLKDVPRLRVDDVDYGLRVKAVMESQRAAIPPIDVIEERIAA